MRIDPDKVLVRTKLGEKFFRNDFVGNLKNGDRVSVHYDYVSERIKQNHVNRMLRRRKNE